MAVPFDGFRWVEPYGGDLVGYLVAFDDWERHFLDARAHDGLSRRDDGRHGLWLAD
jgi:hypothetical protein